MTTRLTLTAIAVAALACLTTTGAQAQAVAQEQAQAVQVGTFYNTGVDNSQAVLANGAPETHYVIFSTPDSSTPGVRVATSANNYPIGPWLGDDSISAWIGPNSPTLEGAVGYYDYKTTFDLTGFDASTAALNGMWAADNSGVDIIINGVSAGQTTTNGFNSFTSFSVATGFVSGFNTIDFIVNNYDGPTGLRVEGVLTADVAVAPVPEPMSLAILGVGLAGIGLTRRFNRA